MILPLAEQAAEQSAAHPVVLALLYALLHTCAPDHLATLLSLSAASRGSAFRVGLAWGFAHSLGMVLVAIILGLLHRGLGVDEEVWEHYGHYFVGASMLLLGVYFLVREEQFLKRQEDGSVVALPCSCHGDGESHRAAEHHAAEENHDHHHHREAPAVCGSCDEEGEPLLPKHSDGGSQRSFFALREVRSAVLGLFQGLCCPLGVVGVGFLATLGASGMLAFVLVFLAVSCLATAALSLLWSRLAIEGSSGAGCSPTLLYRCSAAVTMLLGGLWILANAMGWLERLDFVHKVHHHHHHSGMDMAHPH